MFFGRAFDLGIRMVHKLITSHLFELLKCRLNEIRQIDAMLDRIVEQKSQHFNLHILCFFFPK